MFGLNSFIWLLIVTLKSPTWVTSLITISATPSGKKFKKLDWTSGRIDTKVVWLIGTPCHCWEILTKILGVESLIFNDKSILELSIFVPGGLQLSYCNTSGLGQIVWEVQ